MSKRRGGKVEEERNKNLLKREGMKKKDVHLLNKRRGMKGKQAKSLTLTFFPSEGK